MPNRVLICGGEAGDLSEFVSVSGAGFTVQSSQKVSGSYAMRCNSGTTDEFYGKLQKVDATTCAFVGIDAATLYVSVDFWYDTKPASASEGILHFYDAANARKGYIRIGSDGTLRVFSSTGQIGVGTTVIGSGIANKVKIGIKVVTGTSGAYELTINGVSELSGTGNFLTTNHDHIRLGRSVNHNNQAVDCYYDNVIVDTAAFPVQTAIVLAGKPIGAGNYTAFTGTFADVDEVPTDGDTTIINTVLGAGTAESVTLQSAATVGISGTINSIFAYWRVRNLIGTAGFRYRIRSGGTDSDNSADNSPGSTYVTRGRMMNTDPTDAGAWTIAKYDALELGVVANNVVEHRCSTMLAMVEFTPGGGGSPFGNEGTAFNGGKALTGPLR